VNLHVDRLALRLAGISAADGRRLAELVGERLAAAPSPAGAADTGTMRLTVDAQPGEGLDSMAHRIVEALLRELARPL
jgi:hypothetical protein